MTGLRRVVGLPTVIATSAGMAIATVSLTADVQVGLHLPGASGWIPVLLAGGIAALAAACFAELVGMFPTAAGIKLFIEKAFGEKVALFCAQLYVGISVLIVGSESYVLAQVLHYAFPSIGPVWWVLGFLTLMALINLRGISLTGWTQDLLTYAMLAGMAGLSLLALMRPGAPPVPQPLATGSGFSFAQALALGVFLYLGFEWVTPLAEEVRDARSIPRGMFVALGVLAVIYSLLHVGMMTLVPKGQLASSPIPHILFGEAAFGRTGLVIMALISTLASVTSFNAGLMTASRFLYAMARDNAAPGFFARLHPRWATPWVSIIGLYLLSAAMAAFVLATGLFRPFIFLGAAIECLIFVAMGAAVLKLRRSMPERAREYRAGRSGLVPALVVLLYAALMILVFVPDPNGAPADTRAQFWALGFLAASAVLVLGYVQWAVPKLRAAAAARAAQSRRRRRPGADQKA